jgi:hypothetical protein
MGQDQKVHYHVHLDRVRGIPNRNVSARPSRRHANAKCECERASERERTLLTEGYSIVSEFMWLSRSGILANSWVQTLPPKVCPGVRSLQNDLPRYRPIMSQGIRNGISLSTISSTRPNPDERVFRLRGWEAVARPSWFHTF